MGKLQLKLIKNLLENNKIDYKLIEHDSVYITKKTELRPNSYSIKSIVLKTEEGKFILALVPTDRETNLKKLARIFGTKSLSLASQEEVIKKTGCEIGGCHPFGILSRLLTHMDKSILNNEIIEFNAGLPHVIIKMRSNDLANLIKPQIEDFSIL